LWVGSGNQRWFGLIGLVPLLTAVAGTCPLYTLLRINTCRTQAALTMGAPDWSRRASRQ
jgi:hypothetical protein